MSPFAGLAFHPLDGITQAISYMWTLFYCPTHFLTHEILLFATGVWTTNIHDNIHGKVWILGDSSGGRGCGYDGHKLSNCVLVLVGWGQSCACSRLLYAVGVVHLGLLIQAHIMRNPAIAGAPPRAGLRVELRMRHAAQSHFAHHPCVCCVCTQVWPIMGARYHTIHHTTYKHNHGHYTVFFDALYNTCLHPEEYDDDLALDSPPESEESGAEEVGVALCSPGSLSVHLRWNMWGIACVRGFDFHPTYDMEPRMLQRSVDSQLCSMTV